MKHFRILIFMGIFLLYSLPVRGLEPANPNANEKAKAILNYLEQLPNKADKRVVSGQFTNFGAGASLVLFKETFAKTGHWPAMLGVDYADFGRGGLTTKTATALCTDFWNQGGLVTISAHLYNPMNPKGGGLRDKGVAIADIIKPGSDTYTRWMQELDTMAEGLKELQDAGVVVLWRPFHEMNGGWFWWGAQKPDDFIAVWRHMFDYFTKEKGLNNLLWVYSPNHGTKVKDYYPGDQYTDIIGLDAYTNNIDKNTIKGYDEITTINKPFGFTEYGPYGPQRPPGDYDYRRFIDGIIKEFPKTSFFMSWSEKWSIPRNNYSKEFMDHPWIIDRNDLAGLWNKGKQEPLKVCLVSGSAEYESDTCLAKYKKFLEENYDVKCTLLKASGFHDLPGLEALDTCDTALFFTRRLVIDGEQLDKVKKYFEAGKPAVALRTASHGFQNWLAFDKEVLGGNYQNHFGNDWSQKVVIRESARNHPILNGVESFCSPYSLYRTEPVAEDATILLDSSIPEEKPQPSGWVREHKGGRIFYSSLGGLSDFDNASFLRMVTNALFWTAKQNVRQTKIPEVKTPEKKEEPLQLYLRSKLQGFKASDAWRDVYFNEEWKTNETAIIICDMWDKHWCKGATERCEALAVKMNPVVKACRDHGIQIIHAPSDTLGFYAGTPQRLRMLQTLACPLPESRDIKDATLPIDDSDGGCDTGNPDYQAWSRQNAHIEIGDYDGISQDGKEIYYFLHQQGIKNIIIMGVHTNMCILNRSFAIKQMTRWGMRCVLVRDLTDSMYDPKDPPKVSHDKGTNLVIDHIEKYWCPSILSSELVEGLR